MYFPANPFCLVYANDNSALIPEFWANESIRILEEEMVMGNLVHRDFQPILARFGETVHTRKPAELQAYRKVDGDNVTTQDVSSTDVEVKLNQWIHVSFVINDGELTKAFKDLVQFYMEPAMIANARMLDQCLAAQAFQFFPNYAGGLDQLSSSTAKDYLLDLKGVLDQNKAYGSGRNLILASNSEVEALKADVFHHADKLGDGGRALREAELGRKFGFRTYMDLNTPSATAATLDTATTMEAAAAAGSTTLSLTDELEIGQWFTAVGDYTPLRVATSPGTTTPFSTTIQFATKRAIADSAAVQPYATGAVDLVAGYASGWSKKIHVDGTGVPHVGQLISFNDGDGSTGTIRTPVYMIVWVENTGGSDYDIMLDRPLETALANDDLVGYGPNGDYNFAFHRNALTLVNRPLQAPIRGTGALSATTSHNGLSMRATITYDGVSQGHRITLDSLFGVKVLDTDLGAVLLG